MNRSPRFSVRLACALLAAAWGIAGGTAAGMPGADSDIEQTPRRLPGVEPATGNSLPPQAAEGVAPSLAGDAGAPIPVPDRWRLVESIGVTERWWDPYHQNTLKGDRPIGGEWFVSFSAFADISYESRTFPAGTILDQRNLIQNLGVSLSVLRGDTSFKPPDVEFRVTTIASVNVIHSSGAASGSGDDVTLRHVGLQEAFVTVNLRDVSSRYDFDALRAGIQPFSIDFRGFLFRDQPVGLRLFGNRANNRVQYNLAWLRRPRKDLTGRLNDVSLTLRDEDLFVFNLYLHDAMRVGYSSQWTAVYDRNRQRGIGQSGHDVGYIGYNGDGHLGRANLTTALYLARGRTLPDGAVGKADIRAWFAAFEPSIDFSWMRLRGSLLLASGDSQPGDGRSEGFDAIAENPLFAGADTSFWIHESPQLIDVAGDAVRLTARNGLLPALRGADPSSPANFENPGLQLFGGGADFDLTPGLSLTTGVRYLRFSDTSSLEALVGRTVERDIGWDYSAAITWRPALNQNIVLRLSAALLFPGSGFADLYPAVRDERAVHSILGNAVLAY